MLELAGALLDAVEDGRRIAVATVVEIDGSAPRALGTSMAVDEHGRVIGSISGGCVEGAVYEACTRVLETGVPERCAFGFTDEDAFAVGLACGGRITVVVRELAAPAPGAASSSPATSVTSVAQAAREARDARGGSDADVLDELRRARTGEAAGIAIVPTPNGAPLLLAAHAGDLSEPGALLSQVRSGLRGAIHRGRTVRRRIECEGESVEAVLLVSAPPPRLIVFGAVDFSAALAAAGAQLGYRVTVCDARPVFATAERFPGVEVVTRWPSDYLASTEVDERTVVCVLTHDDKFDVPLIETALALPIAYVGAMGSRRTHDRRLAALRERGVDEGALAALHSPIGLDLGASTPEETAISILAEVIAVRTGAAARAVSSLRDTSGPIHVPADS